MADVSCPNCGKIASCSYLGEWGGGVDYCDHYSLHCAHCGHTSQDDRSASGPYFGDGVTNCPFCGRSNLEHNQADTPASPPAPPSAADLRDQLPPAAAKALQLLKQETPWVDRGTHGERRRAPFVVDRSTSSPAEVSVVAWHNQRVGSYLGDYDDWYRSREYALRADWFFAVLARLPAGGEISAQGRAEVVERDEASGADCDDPHCNVTGLEVPIMFRLELSTDLRSATLTLLEECNGAWVPLTQLRQTDSTAGSVSPAIL